MGEAALALLAVGLGQAVGADRELHAVLAVVAAAAFLAGAG